MEFELECISVFCLLESPCSLELLEFSHQLILTFSLFRITTPRTTSCCSLSLQINHAFSLGSRTTTGVVLRWTIGGLCRQSRRLAFSSRRACGSGQSMRKIEIARNLLLYRSPSFRISYTHHELIEWSSACDERVVEYCTKRLRVYSKKCPSCMSKD